MNWVQSVSLESQYVVNQINTTAQDLLDLLRTYVIDADDRLLVVCLDNSDWADFNPMFNPNNL